MRSTLVKFALTLIAGASFATGAAAQAPLEEVKIAFSWLRNGQYAGLMVADVAGVDETTAQTALDQTGGDIRRAILVALGLSLEEADARIANSHGPFQTVLSSLVD